MSGLVVGGAATADAIATAGGTVVAVDVKQGSDNRLIWKDADVADEAESKAAVQEAVARGRLSGLINCAGIAGARRLRRRSSPCNR